MLCVGSKYFKGSVILGFCGFNQFNVSKFSSQANQVLNKGSAWYLCRVEAQAQPRQGVW